jgi:type IV pilus assembly protein PilY1
MKRANTCLIKKAIAMTAVFCMTTQSTFAALLSLPQVPLYAATATPPKVMLTISKDQQLFKKAYNDYSDLDGDGQLETTYKHAIDYYGYFDPSKCYTYSTSNNRFEPASVSADKYCSGQWSGNFLNWVSMSRMDAVRKLLYGGTRSTDQTNGIDGSGNPISPNAVTVLERAFIPTDAHAWSKYYNGSDIARLTPFSPATATAYSAITSSLIAVVSGDIDLPFTTAQSANMSLGDQIKVQRTAVPGTYFLGTVLGFSNANKTVSVRVNAAGISASGSDTLWTVTNLSRTGISFCNMTPGSGSGSDSRSSTNTQPPLIRVAQGNFGLWNANERWQCQWFEDNNNQQSGFTGGLRSNGNQASLSEINASAENPSRATHGLGSGSAVGEYIARVQVCVPTLLGDEKCERYPNGNYKPIGLIQEYGDRDLIHFGLMTGSHAKNVSGGVLRKNVGTTSDEINVSTDGTFIGANYRPPSAPRSTTSSATSPGIIRTLDFMRVYGYLYSDGTYIGSSGDTCTYQLTSITENTCTSWGNPMSEIFFEAVRYFAGNTENPSYTYSATSAKDNELGLPLAAWADPLTASTYCAPLNVVVLNSSVSTSDDDLRSTASTSIGGSSGLTIAALTNAVGTAEGITGGTSFVGKMIGSSPTPAANPGFELCTAKTISALGDVSGICPEGPTVAGSYLIAGIAHRAHTQRIRTDITPPATDTKALKITSYGIQLSTNVPTLTIPVPGSTTGQKVIIQPIYRLDLGSSFGGGALVDMRLIRQQTAGSISSGKVYLTWEDSEQGGDYDQDMNGSLEWSLNAATNTITVTTDAISASTANPQGFGYAISGTTQDGAHFHSGILGFNFTDPVSGILGCTNCNVVSAPSGQRGPQSVTYTVGGTAATSLKDPLWYMAKYGAFDESMPSPVSNKNNLPDLPDEWDSKLTDGSPGSDGIPDNYFLVTDPLGLEAALDRAFRNILANASLTSIATNSTSLQTLSDIYQARFNTSDWSGSLAAYAVDPTTVTISSTPSWDAGLVMNGQNFNTGRNIITFDDTATVRDGVAFRWTPVSAGITSISATLQTALNKNPSSGSADGKGSRRLDYLRGDPTYEVSTGATRFRSRPQTKLGDIINSDPMYVGPPNGIILDPSYETFRESAGVSGRTPMVYAAANDGMLHGFDAATGQEKIAYIPSKTFASLNKLTAPGYSHQFYVDGSPEVQDAQISGAWKTVLVGGLGRGGQGLYALDVSKPSLFNEDNAAALVLWEFNDTDDRDLGYIYGKPLIRKMANGKWAAIVSGGYNNSESDGTPSTTGHAYLFIIFLDGPTGTNRTWIAGTDYIKIDTGQGTVSTPNGLADPFAADTDIDSKVNYVYAGDLLGNFWKFDLSSSTTSNWTLAANRVVLFQAKDGTGGSALAQPITAAAEGTLHPTGVGYMIAFGTGKYLENADVSSTTVQTFYGIWDKDDSKGNIASQTVATRSQLLQQTATNVTPAGGTAVYRVVTNNAPNWSSNRGWYMDFPTTSERSVFRPLILSGRLIYTTMIPSTVACSLGGTSFLMIVDPTTGGRIDSAVLDSTGDGTLSSADKITSAGTTVYASGLQSTVGITPTPAIVLGGPAVSTPPPGDAIYGTTGPLLAGSGLLIAYAIGGGSGGRTTTILGLAASSGRVSWREVLAR